MTLGASFHPPTVTAWSMRSMTYELRLINLPHKGTHLYDEMNLTGGSGSTLRYKLHQCSQSKYLQEITYLIEESIIILFSAGASCLLSSLIQARNVFRWQVGTNRLEQIRPVLVRS